MFKETKSIYIVLLCLCIVIGIVYAFDISLEEPWHPMQQISLSQENTISIDEDGNGNVDRASYSIKSVTLYPSISQSNVCTNDFSNTNCDSRYYSYGEKVSNAHHFDGHITSDFCLADKSNCNEMYKMCNESGICKNIYADSISFNIPIFESGDIYAPTTIKINNSALQENEVTISDNIKYYENQVMSVNNLYFSDLENNLHIDLDCWNSSQIYEYEFWQCGGDISGNIVDIYGDLITNNLSVTYSSYYNDSYKTPSESSENIVNISYNMRFAVMYLYGEYDYVENCPDGWQEVGYGTYYDKSYSGDPTSVIIKARTCIRESPCVVLYNYGYNYGNSPSPCPSGWQDAGVGVFDEIDNEPYGTYTTYVRTCYKCFGE